MRRSDRWLILTAYLLLVGIVAFGAWWLQDEAERAQRQRCEVANLEFGLLAVELFALPQEVRDSQGPALEKLMSDAADVTVEICEGTGVDPSSNPPGEDRSVVEG